MDKKIDKSQMRAVVRRRWLRLGAVAVAVIAVLVWFLGNITSGVNMSDLKVSAVEQGPLDITVSGTGRVVPARQEIINSPVSTSVVAVYAQPGDSVTKGMPLLQLDLAQEQTELGKLQDSRTMQLAELEQLQLRNRTTVSDLEMQVKVAQMEVSRLKIEVDNERRLDSLGSGTGDRVRQAETAYASAVLSLEQLHKRLRNERLSASAAERGTRLSVNTADRDISLMNKTLLQGSVPAPLDGVLTFIVTDLGTRIGAGEKVAVVADLSSFKVLGEVPEANGSRVEVGARVSIRVSGGAVAGTVSNITPQAKNGVVSFVVRADNPRDKRLHSGIRAELQVSCGYKSSVLRVANGTFYRGPGNYSVFVFDGDNRLKRRQIKAGESNRDYVEILDGLKAGDRVVVNDMNDFQNKNKLKVVK